MGGEEVQLHSSLTSVLRIWRWEVNLTPRPPYLLESTQALTEYEAGSGRFGEDKTSCPCRDSIPGLSSYTD